MPSREPGILTIPSFARSWTAYTVSGFGAPVTLLAVQTLVLVELDGSASEVGLVTAARWVPYLLFGIVVGAAVGRRRRLPMMVATDTALVTCSWWCTSMWVTDRLTVSVLVVVMTVVGFIVFGAPLAAFSLIGSGCSAPSRWSLPGSGR